MADLDLPYFDQIIANLASHPDSGLAAAFARHVHWGCYADPAHADDSIEGYVAAAEHMTERICAAARVASKQRVLDVGCGFGGTIAHLDERLTDCDFVGLNIDERQLRRARATVSPHASNVITFTQGDACALPFDDDEFDTLLAVECAFHFRSRKQFLREAARVLRPGGTLALTDFVLADGKLADLTRWIQQADRPDDDFYGANAKPIAAAAYARNARAVGFEPLADDDITANTLPTYPAMRRVYRDAGLPDGESATDYLEAIATHGFVQYHLLSFRLTQP